MDIPLEINKINTNYNRGIIMKKVIERKEESVIYSDELNDVLYLGVVTATMRRRCFILKAGLRYYLRGADDVGIFHISESHFSEGGYNSLKSIHNKGHDIYVFDTQKELFKWLAE